MPSVADVLFSIDLDIEGGSTAYFTSFVNQLRSHMNSASKQSVSFMLIVRYRDSFGSGTTSLRRHNAHSQTLISEGTFISHTCCNMLISGTLSVINAVGFDAILVQFCELGG